MKTQIDELEDYDKDDEYDGDDLFDDLTFSENDEFDELMNENE